MFANLLQKNYWNCGGERNMCQWLADKEIEVVFDHYTGFEGAPEYQFVAVYKSAAKVFRMWAGWFDEIMGKISPKEESWTSLALLYHLDRGWFDTSPWRLKEVESAIAQLKELHEKLELGENKDICRKLLEFLSVEYSSGATIFIGYD